MAVMVVVGAAASLPGADDAGAPVVRTRRVYHATRINPAPPVLDGKLDDACWAGPGEWTGDYTQREPNEGQPPSQPTQLKILYDDRFLYVAIRAFDRDLASVPHLRGKRDEFTGEMVGITFDSYHDQRTAFEFNVTSGGSKIDLQIRDDVVDTTWNAVWEVRVALEPDAWTAEYRIPFSQLRYARQEDQVWGLHSWRWIKRRQEESDWNPIPQDTSGMVFDFGELRGIEGLPPSRRVEILPYVVGQYATAPEEAGNPYRTGSASDFDAGLDAKVGLTSDFTLDLTVNPDFGQVEADPSEINLTTFETFQEERRPFFVEGKDVFTWPLGSDLAFYSRRIGQPPSLEPAATGFVDQPVATRIRAAAKVTGKTHDGLGIGGLYANTAAANARIFENGVERTELVEPATQFFVGRLQQELVPGRTTLGGVATATVRSLDDSDPAAAQLTQHAYTGGLDFRHLWNDRNYEFAADVIGSRVDGTPAAIQALMESPVHNYQRPDADHVDVRTDADSLTGHGGRIRAGRIAGDRWHYQGNYGWRSPGLELNDVGFLTEADRQRFVGSLERVVTTPGAVLRNYSASLAQFEIYDFGGTHLNSSTELEGEFRLNSDWRIEPELAFDRGTRDTHMLRGGPSFLVPAETKFGLRVESPGTETWHWYVELEHQTFDAGASRGSTLELGFIWRALGLLSVHPEITYATADMDHQYADTATAAPGGESRYVLGRMDQSTLGTTVRLDVNLTPTLSLSWYGSLFASSGDFVQFKRVSDPLAARYEDRFVRLDGGITPDPSGDFYNVIDGAETYTFANPDFDLRELQSNLVLRWEFRAGSNLYLVWTQNRGDSDVVPGFSAGDDYSRLLHAPAENTLLLKVSYWFSR